VRLDGTETAQTTDANGYYSFSGLAAGQNYTVVPILTEFEFTPATRTFQGLSANQTADFSANRTIVTIAGTVVDENNNPVSGATINLTGSQTALAITDALGVFQFAGLAANGNYNVAASKQHYSFVPASHSVSTLDENLSLSFTAQLNRHSINGRITDPNGVGISGAAVSLDQAAEPQTTDANGYYSFTQLPAGVNYTVIPASTHYDFTPESVSFEDLSANQTADFVGNPRYVSFDGSVVDEDGRPISGATVNLSGTQSASAITNQNGQFHFQNLLKTGAYTVTVSKRHYTFAIGSRTIEHPLENVTLEFSARLNRHSISGCITRANGSAVSGVTVGLSQSSIAPVTTDNNGFYSFANLAAGQNYTVLPMSTEYSFAPFDKNFQDLGSDQTADFAAKLAPVILTLAGTDTAIALESTLLIPQPFSVLSSIAFSVDGYTRIMIFAKNLEQVEPPVQTSLVAEDDQGNLHPLTIENIGVVSGQSWLKQINIKLSPSLINGRCVKLQITAAGTNSNKARICIDSVSP